MKGLFPLREEEEDEEERKELWFIAATWRSLIERGGARDTECARAMREKSRELDHQDHVGGDEKCFAEITPELIYVLAKRSLNYPS